MDLVSGHEEGGGGKELEEDGHGALGSVVVAARVQLCRLVRSGYAGARTPGRGSRTPFGTVQRGSYHTYNELACGSWGLEGGLPPKKKLVRCCTQNRSLGATGTEGAPRAGKKKPRTAADGWRNGGCTVVHAVGPLPCTRLAMTVYPVRHDQTEQGVLLSCTLDGARSY